MDEIQDSSAPPPPGMMERLGLEGQNPPASIEQPAPSEPAQSPQQTPDMPPGMLERLASELKQEEFSTPTQSTLAALEGAGRGLAGPAFTGAQKLLGGDPERILAREEANPELAGGAEALTLAGSMLTGTGEAAILAKVGSKVTKAFEGASAMSRIAAKAAGSATEMGLFQGGSETSHMILNDPNQSAQTAITNIGLAAALGGGLGALSSGTAELWKAKVGGKLGQVAEDFKGRMTEHLENPNPVEALGNELQEHYKNITGMADEVYGPTGLKAQDIAKAMPEMHEGITDQATNIYSDMKKSIEKMVEKPNSYPERLSSKLAENLDQYQKVVSEAKAPAEIFDATQNLKNKLQGYAKFDKIVKPIDEAYDFVQDAKKMAHSLRESLEDTDVWGNAAKRQQSINKAFTEFLPSLKDFEKKFTSELNGERVIDSGKISTYLNQLGKPNAEIKQKMLENFLKASEKYSKVIGDTHANLGIDHPIQPSSLSAAKGTLKELTTGAKLADAFYHKGMSKAAGSAMGAGVGGAIGHALGAGGIGALIGEHALGPFFSDVLPSIAKPLMTTIGNGEGFKAAADYAAHVAKGEAFVSKATKNLFKSGAMVLAEHEIPSDKEIAKLDKTLKAYQKDPELLTKQGTKVGHYLPENGASIAQTSANVVNYINNQRPDANMNRAPLDPELKPSAEKQAKFKKTLTIAEQPLVILDRLKRGVLTSKDVADMQTMYPELHSGLVSKITEEMVNMMAKGQPIPYKMRQGLSVFMGQPMDSTLTPRGILAAQQPMAAENPNPQNPAGMQPAKNASKSSMEGLNKLSSQYQTGLQHRESMRQTKN